MRPESYERRANIYSRRGEEETESMGQRGSYTEATHRRYAGPSGNGNPCVDLGCTVSTDPAKMGQFQRTSTAIMTVSRHVEKVVRCLTVAGVRSSLLGGSLSYR